MNQTTNDWLTTVRDDLLEVIEQNNTFTKGVRENINGRRVSITLTDQGDYFEAYIVVDSLEDIEQAIQDVKLIRNVIGTDEGRNKTIGRYKEKWAEIHVEVDEESIRRL